MSGLFIAFEGIDGAGKWTQARRTRDWLEEKVKNLVVFSSEPNRSDWDSAKSGSPLGDAIGDILGGKRKMLRPLEFQRMYVLDRAQDILCFIQPRLERGAVYLIERYAFSTIAYGMLSGLPAETFIDLHRQILGPSMIWPHLTIVLDISGKEAARRIAERTVSLQKKREYFERADMLGRVRQNYLAVANRPEFKERVVVVNGERSEEEVFGDIRRRIEPLLPLLNQ